MQKLIYILLLLQITLQTSAQYISEVLEYKPAPGQLINESPWGIPHATQTIIGGITGHLSLGAWGGYVIFRFNNAVENHPNNPYGVDFTIFGNPLSDWSEPGIVWVMKDENENNLPDDTWYQLAGSDYFFSNTIHNNEITYTNPQSSFAVNVPWDDNQGNTGFIFVNSWHQQPYYPLTDSFPNVANHQYTLTGTRIFPEIDSTSTMIKLYKRGFGYVDNNLRGSSPYEIPDNPYTKNVEGSGGDAFDISWAVNAEGDYIELDEIHFVKVQNGVLAHAGWLGEVSTEITGAVDVAPNPILIGENEMIVIRDLPALILEETIQAEAHVFLNGKPQTDAAISWSVSMNGASVDQNGTITLTQSGNLELTAMLTNNPQITTTKTAKVELGNALQELNYQCLDIYPNPATNNIFIPQNGVVRIYSIKGKLLIEQNLSSANTINIENLPIGVYLVQCKTTQMVFAGKLIKK